MYTKDKTLKKNEPTLFLYKKLVHYNLSVFICYSFF